MENALWKEVCIGKSPINYYKWSIFNCYVWLPEGSSFIGLHQNDYPVNKHKSDMHHVQPDNSLKMVVVHSYVKLPEGVLSYWLFDCLYRRNGLKPMPSPDTNRSPIGFLFHALRSLLGSTYVHIYIYLHTYYVTENTGLFGFSSWFDYIPIASHDAANFSCQIQIFIIQLHIY